MSLNTSAPSRSAAGGNSVEGATMRTWAPMVFNTLMLERATREYYHFFGLDQEKLARAKPDALIMHPGPMNRGVEIASTIADHSRSVIREQVEMGVAVRMAVLEAMARQLPNR